MVLKSFKPKHPTKPTSTSTTTKRTPLPADVISLINTHNVDSLLWGDNTEKVARYIQRGGARTPAEGGEEEVDPWRGGAIE